MKFILPLVLAFSSQAGFASVASFTCTSVEYDANFNVIGNQSVTGQPSQTKPGAFEAAIANHDGTVTFDGLATDASDSYPDINYTITDTSTTPASGLILDAPGNFPYTYNWEETNGGFFDVTCAMTVAN